MDCPSEEGLIRLTLQDDPQILLLQFDLAHRTLTVLHNQEVSVILKKLLPLNLGTSLSSDVQASDIDKSSLQIEKANSEIAQNAESAVLKILLVINASMFFFEIILGFAAQSTGLIADAMDMFADAAVYGVSLYAVGKAASLQRNAARTAGYAQLLLAGFALAEVIRRFIFGSEPEANYMILVSLLALIANILCLKLIYRHRDGGAHMKASVIFSANDVIANIGVIAAGILVNFFESPYPDLFIGLIIAFIVLRGSFAILKISKVG